MAHTDLIPTELSSDTALAMLIVIAALTASVILVGWLFTRLTPARRRDLVELVRAFRRGPKDPE